MTCMSTAAGSSLALLHDERSQHLHLARMAYRFQPNAVMAKSASLGLKREEDEEEEEEWGCLGDARGKR